MDTSFADAVATNNDDDSSSWTANHHLVGNKSVTRTILTCTNTTGDIYSYKTHTATIAAFAPEMPLQRKPALWRAWINNNNGNNDNNSNCYYRAMDCVASDWQQELSTVAVPSTAAISMVQERYAELVYQTVLQKWLPQLVLTAAVEECQSQFLQQATTNNSNNTSSRCAATPLSLQPPAYYTTSPSTYLSAPSTTTTTTFNNNMNSFLLLIQFTPTQLVGRIKQGCLLAWNQYYNTAIATTLEQPTQHYYNRTSSRRRLALQQQQQDMMADNTTNNNSNALYKVQPGGRIALYLQQELLTSKQQRRQEEEEEEEASTDAQETLADAPPFIENKETTNQSPSHVSNNNNNKSVQKDLNETKNDDEVHNVEMADLSDDDQEEPEEPDDDFAPAEDEDDDDDDDDDEIGSIKENAKTLEVDMKDGTAEDSEEVEEDDEDDEEEEEEDIDLVHDDNPYLQVTGPAIVEWLGKKTAKHLTSSDIQTCFPSLMMIQAKKKKNISKEMEQTGGQIADYLSPTDMLIWRRLLEPHGSLIVTPEARFCFQLANTEFDGSDIAEWETSSFSRSTLQVRVWNPKAEEEMAQRALEEQAVAEMEYREAKAWGYWRYKGINTGCTVWPSWLESVSNWVKEHHHAGESSTSTADDAAVEVVQQDQALAQALAEQEAATTTRRSRRAAEGGGGGVYYGSQSNMTQKQLMDTCLRLVSQNSYQTAMGFMNAVPDESSDPLRRIRTAIGKLIWKRNQLARLPVQPSWSDSSVWSQVSKAPLVTRNTEKEDSLAVQYEDSDKDRLIEYIRELHQTELRLRQMVMDNLADIPIAMIASSADERAGTMEAMDDSNFEDMSSITWLSSGHDLLGKIIYRPPVTAHSDDVAPCSWYRVQDYCEPVASEPVEEEVNSERPQIGNAKEAVAVQRRCRFRAVPASINGNVEGFPGASLLLTEGQVHAGMKAAEIEKRRASTPQNFAENPFAGAKTSHVTLIPAEGSAAPHITGTVVGHDSLVDDDMKFHQRILLLPDAGSDAMWVRLGFPDSGVTECRVEGDPVLYTVQQFEYHHSSPAFKECRDIVNYLSRHAKAGPFMEPVDPIALNIPDYFSVIKHPMDISTLSENLESGKYSNIPPREAKGRSPTARMLSGPFRKDVELIFDNAMLFNPPNDWIHQSAATIKKAVTRKIDQAIRSAEEKYSSRSRAAHSIYVDEDSDVDAYVYESDDDEEYGGSGRNRKRKHTSTRTPLKEDSSTRSIERPIRLHKVLSESMGLRGPLANIPADTDVQAFSLPNGWTCRRRSSDENVADEDKKPDESASSELDELIDLHKALEEQEASGLRRSSRSHPTESDQSGGGGNAAGKGGIEFICVEGPCASLLGASDGSEAPRSRSQIESARESLHEQYFAKRYQKLYKTLECESYGSYVDGSFPPYLGRVVPTGAGYDQPHDSSICRWEIRNSYLIPAIRWVIRGLIRSDHLSELEPVDTATDAGVILPNHVYYLDTKAEPFAVVDTLELTRKKESERSSSRK